MLDAIEAAELARDREDWQAFGTHSLRFHLHIVGLLRSPLLDAFFTNVAAQMRLVFAVAPDEENFQRPWLERDREIHDLLAAGRRNEAAEAMTRYLDDYKQRGRPEQQLKQGSSSRGLTLPSVAQTSSRHR